MRMRTLLSGAIGVASFIAWTVLPRKFQDASALAGSFQGTALPSMRKSSTVMPSFRNLASTGRSRIASGWCAFMYRRKISRSRGSGLWLV